MSKKLTRRRRAVVLILVLWIATVLSLLAYSVTYQMALETKLTSMRKKTVGADALARAGLAVAFTDLRNDLLFDYSDKNGSPQPYDAISDVWYRPADEREDGYELGENDGKYYFEVRDEERFLNLNVVAKPPAKPLLIAILEQLGYEEEDAEIVASAIIDWADADDQPALETSPGNEGLTYGLFQAEDRGESPREDDVERAILPNEPYLTVEGLMDVYGVTPELFFGPETPEAIYYRQMIGETAYDGGRFELDRRSGSRRGEAPLGLRDFFTVYGSEKLNLNTAPKHILEALFEAAGQSDPDGLAERVVRERGDERRKPDPDNAFQNLGEVNSKVPELGAIVGAAGRFHPLDVKSEVFTVTARGEEGGIAQQLQVTVHRALETMQRDDSFEAIDRAKERLERYEDKRERMRRRDDDERVFQVPAIRIVQWHRE
ncbi:MAG: type II secretion system protein GspK [Sumerlaeia bacterium]